MKLLLCLPNTEDFEVLRNDFLVRTGLTWPAKLETTSTLFSFRYMQHDIDVLFTGNTLFETSYKVTKTIANRYNLALYAGLANSASPDIMVGDIVNVIKEKPLHFTTEGTDIYTANLLHHEDYPHFKGAFVNMNNSYMNIFLDFKKVVSGTLQAPLRDLVENFATLHKISILSQNGIGFVYPCMYERQSFYQIRAIEKSLISGETDRQKAIATLNKTLLEILEKI